MWRILPSSFSSASTPIDSAMGTRGSGAELVQVDPVEPQPGQAALASLAQVLGPVIRIAPYPSRFTVRSPPTSIMPVAATVTVAFMDVPL